MNHDQKHEGQNNSVFLFCTFSFLQICSCATYVLIWQWFCSIFIIKIESAYDMNRN